LVTTGTLVVALPEFGASQTTVTSAVNTIGSKP
jgi:hypothetical protein